MLSNAQHAVQPKGLDMQQGSGRRQAWLQQVERLEQYGEHHVREGLAVCAAARQRLYTSHMISKIVSEVSDLESLRTARATSQCGGASSSPCCAAASHA